MSTKPFLILIVLLAVACYAGAGMSGFRPDKEEGDPSLTEIRERKTTLTENHFASMLDSLLAPLAGKVVLSEVRPRQGAGFKFDVSQDGSHGTLTLAKNTSCTLEMPPEPDEKVRTVELALASEWPVSVLYWAAGDNRPDADDAPQLLKKGKSMRLAVGAEGGTLEINNEGEMPSIVRFE